MESEIKIKKRSYAIKYDEYQKIIEIIRILFA